MDRFYEDADSLFVQAYDAFYRADLPQYSGDADFYLQLAREDNGGVLELACGTGRVTLPLVEAGLAVTGVDFSEGMLTVARRKAAALPADVQDRLTLQQGNMCELDLGCSFGFIFLAFRSFQHILSIDQQKQLLSAARRHLAPGGRLALHLFDPRLDFLLDDAAPPPGMSGRLDATGRRFSAEVMQIRFDHLAQILRCVWRYAELGPGDAVLRQDEREMALRWTFRWELHHLLALCGFSVEAEYSDFERSPPAYGRELIVVARAA